MKRLLTAFIILFLQFSAKAQTNADAVYMPNIAGVKLFLQGNQLAYPIIFLNSTDLLELHFDDLDARIKNYYYTFQLCNADWTPVNLSTFDYLKGFSQMRISQYRLSSVALTRYFHYQAVLPDKNVVPTKSGNYLLKVFLDGDTSKLAFTRRILVVDKQAEIGVQILQPFNSEIFRTHQKVQFVVNKGQMNILSPATQIQAVILQNFRWDNAKTNIKPTFIRGNTMEFNTENDAVFPAGKEYRWADLRSFRFQSDRVASANYKSTPVDIILQPDQVRFEQRYLNRKDYNGFYFVETLDAPNPWWQSDYGWVHFSFVPADNQPYPDKKVYVLGELTNNNTNDTAAMTYNAEKGIYEKAMFLKQGYYSYTYVTKDAGNRRAAPQTAQTDGNYWETENDYTVLIYFRSIAGRHDELIGVTTINSVNNRRLGN